MFRVGLGVLLFTTVSLADGGGGFWGGALPVVSGIGGIVLGLLAALPSIRALQRDISDAEALTAKFIQKWRNRIPNKELEGDLKRLFRRYDVLTESAADVAERFRMKRMARILRGIIPSGSARL